MARLELHHRFPSDSLKALSALSTRDIVIESRALSDVEALEIGFALQ